MDLTEEGLLGSGLLSESEHRRLRAEVRPERVRVKGLILSDTHAPVWAVLETESGEHLGNYKIYRMVPPGTILAVIPATYQLAEMESGEVPPLKDRVACGILVVMTIPAITDQVGTVRRGFQRGSYRLPYREWVLEAGDWGAPAEAAQVGDHLSAPALTRLPR